MDIAFDPFAGSLYSLIFVANSGSDTVSVINGDTNQVLGKPIIVGHQPSSLFVNQITKRLYVANFGSRTVSVIDYVISPSGNFTYKRVNIPVGRNPTAVSFDTNTNRLFVLNSVAYGTLSVIDGSNNKEIKLIPVGSYPTSLYANPDTQMIYVTNFGSGTVSIINGSINKRITDITLGGSPYAISYNPNTNILYVTNWSSKTISEIFKTDLLDGISFNIDPSNSGNVKCNYISIQNGDYIRYSNGTVLDCKVNTNSGFEFSSWRSDFFPLNSNNTDTTFKISGYGNITANFVPATPIFEPKTVTVNQQAPDLFSFLNQWAALLASIVAIIGCGLTALKFLIRRKPASSTGSVRTTSFF